MEPEFFEVLILGRLTPLFGLENAASSILLSLEALLNLEEGLDTLSVFNLEDDFLEAVEAPFLLRLEVCPLAKGREPLLVSCRLVRLSPKFEDVFKDASELSNRSILLSLSDPRELIPEEPIFLGLLLTASSGIAALEGLLP